MNYYVINPHQNAPNLLLPDYKKKPGSVELCAFLKTIKNKKIKGKKIYGN